MAQEIERKFLITSDAWKDHAREPGIRILQGYLSRGVGSADPAVRVRMLGAIGIITVKGPGLVSRSEFEYEIPAEDAEEMLRNLCQQPVLDKTRYLIDHAGMTWEVDVFSGYLDGLVVAEIELEAEGQSFQTPSWVGQEVTFDIRYLNSNLALANGPPEPMG